MCHGKAVASHIARSRDDGLLVFGTETPPLPGIRTVRVAPDALHDVRGLAALRYGAMPGACVLLRPDQHVAALFRQFDAARIQAAA